VKFDTNDVDNANDNYGSASASVSKSLLKRNAPFTGGISLLLCGSYPPAEHPADLVDRSLERDILFAVNASRLVHEADEDAEEVELHARPLKHRQFFTLRHLACGHDALEHVEDHRVGPLPDGIAILFRHRVAIAVKQLVEIAGLLEDGNIKIVHSILSIKAYRDLFEQIISPENLFEAWATFKSDKRNKADVAEFERHLERNIFQLHRDLRNKTYRHGPYKGFYIHDPKQRHVHKATVRDRVLHHAVFSVLNPIFEETFIPTSFSCRIGFGTHKGVAVLERKARAVARDGAKPCFVLKCDIQKFFDSVDHNILLSIMEKRIKDEEAVWLLRIIVESYSSAKSRERERESMRARAKAFPSAISPLSCSRTFT
jgi:hypothetical protein